MTHNSTMRQRRFLLLAAALVALVLVPTGYALFQSPHVTLASLFGKNMMRADVTMNSGLEWRIDRGTVVTNVPGTLTVHETDGRVQPISTASSTKVSDNDGNAVKLANIKPGWRVVVIWPALGGPADSIKVEKRSAPDA
jgi:hypothetical protein